MKFTLNWLKEYTFLDMPVEALADKLANLSPPGLDRSFFVSGGSEAVESTIKLAGLEVRVLSPVGRHVQLSRTTRQRHFGTDFIAGCQLFFKLK